jgi:hypothetical protein
MGSVSRSGANAGGPRLAYAIIGTLFHSSGSTCYSRALQMTRNKGATNGAARLTPPSSCPPLPPPALQTTHSFKLTLDPSPAAVASPAHVHSHIRPALQGVVQHIDSCSYPPMPLSVRAASIALRHAHRYHHSIYAAVSPTGPRRHRHTNSFCQAGQRPPAANLPAYQYQVPHVGPGADHSPISDRASRPLFSFFFP